jgi:glycerate kinase
MGPGVFGHGLPGVLGQSTGGAAVLAEVKRAFTQRVQPAMACTQLRPEIMEAVLECRSKAQLWLIPLRMKDPTSLATTTANELLATA